MQLIVRCIAAVAAGSFEISREDRELLALFQSLMAERNLGRTAARLRVSRSAAYHALGRLRDVCGDPLFVRNPKGVEPTALALALAPDVDGILARAPLTGGGPDPARGQAFDSSATCTFKLGVADAAIFTVVIPLMKHLRGTAPEMAVRMMSVTSRRVVSLLDRREVDLALVALPNPPARIARMRLLTDRVVVLARRNHPALGSGPLVPKTFAALAQLAVSEQSDIESEAGGGLAGSGLQWHIVMTVPDFLSVPHLVAATDLVALTGERAARHWAEALDLAILEFPFPMRAITLDLLMPAARVHEPALQWLREQILAVCREG